MMQFVKCIVYLYLLSLSLSAHSETIVNDMTVSMRDSGYTIGDTIDMTVTFSLPKGQVIDEESLPLTGRINPWLDIKAIKPIQGKQRAALAVNWQVFATVEIAQALYTPEIVIKTKGDNPKKIMIPQQAFYYSPVLPMPPLKGIERIEDIPPPAFDSMQPLVYMSGCLLLFSICAFVWLWLKDMLPWLPRTPGPMTQLSRELKKTLTADKQLNQQQLRDIHTALNQSAGVSLYPDNLPLLFSNAPYFERERNYVVTFFHQSWTRFYGEPESIEKIDSLATKEWIQRVALGERLFKRNHQSLFRK